MLKRFFSQRTSSAIEKNVIKELNKKRVWKSSFLSQQYLHSIQLYETKWNETETFILCRTFAHRNKTLHRILVHYKNNHLEKDTFCHFEELIKTLFLHLMEKPKEVQALLKHCAQQEWHICKKSHIVALISLATDKEYAPYAMRLWETSILSTFDEIPPTAYAAAIVSGAQMHDTRFVRNVVATFRNQTRRCPEDWKALGKVTIPLLGRIHREEYASVFLRGIFFELGSACAIEIMNEALNTLVDEGYMAEVVHLAASARKNIEEFPNEQTYNILLKMYVRHLIERPWHVEDIYSSFAQDTQYLHTSSCSIVYTLTAQKSLKNKKYALVHRVLSDAHHTSLPSVVMCHLYRTCILAHVEQEQWKAALQTYMKMQTTYGISGVYLPV